MVYGELGKIPTVYFRLHHNVSNIGSAYVDSLYVVIPEKHTICYMDYKKRNSKAKTCVWHVKCLLCVNGFGCVWVYGELGDERRFLHIFKERLEDCFCSAVVGAYLVHA